MDNNNSNDIKERLDKVKFIRAELPNTFRPFTALPPELFKLGRYLTPPAKWLYASLRFFMNTKDGKTYPSYDSIKTISGLSHNAVAKGLDELERFCWVVRMKAKGRHNEYILCYPSFRDRETGEEIPDQLCPTKEQAKEWAKSLRPKQKILTIQNKKQYQI